MTGSFRINHLGSAPMPPSARPVPTFGAEPTQEPLPYGRWAETLRAELLAAALPLGEDIGEPGEIVWFPDRTYGGRAYVPATARPPPGGAVVCLLSLPPARGAGGVTPRAARPPQGARGPPPGEEAPGG